MRWILWTVWHPSTETICAGDGDGSTGAGDGAGDGDGSTGAGDGAGDGT